MLISPEYRDQQLQMHDGKLYGKSGGKWWSDVKDFLDAHACETWLDYGCGTGKLGKHVRKYIERTDPRRRITITEYDPGVRGNDIVPVGLYDLVTCIDVLEHIEPSCLAAVLEHLRVLTRKVLFAVISTRVAGKTLPDGRNAHLIVKPKEWWMGEIDKRFRVTRQWSVRPDEFCILTQPLA